MTEPVTLILDGTPGRRDRVVRTISRLPIADGQVWDVVVRQHIVRRSESQNRRLWALHALAGEKVGCSPAAMHEDMLCEHFGYKEVKMPSGVIHREPLKRSSDRDKKEFREFLEFVEYFYIENLEVVLGDQ